MSLTHTPAVIPMIPTVLLVDSDASYRATLSGRIADNGCRVLTAADGARALDVFRTEDVDLLVTDEHLPVMSALDLLTVTRIAWPETSRVLLTDEITIAPPDDDDVDGLFEKSSSTDSLATTLAGLAAGRRPATRSVA